MVLRLRSCFILGKMKLDNILGVKVSSSSSSRSFPDDLDDTDFAYSFDVEYDDATDPSSRPESIDKHVPLCEPHGAWRAGRPETWSNYNQEPDRSSEDHASIQHASSSSVVSSGLISSKTTMDALQELRGYKTMKNLLIGKGTSDKEAAHVGPAYKTRSSQVSVSSGTLKPPKYLDITGSSQEDRSTNSAADNKESSEDLDAEESSNTNVKFEPRSRGHPQASPGKGVADGDSDAGLSDKNDNKVIGSVNFDEVDVFLNDDIRVGVAY
ncbi:hypothetical protein PS1_019612 [Malus domestica]